MQILNILETPSPRLLSLKPKVLITAKRSFIARNILEQLDYDFTPIGREDVNLGDSEAVKAFLSPLYFDFVIHTACIGGRKTDTNHEDIFESNFDMFYNLFQNRQHFGHLIVFGSTADNLHTGYGRAKRVIRGLVKQSKNMFNLRLEGVWGKYEKEDRFPSYCQTHDEVTIKEDKIMKYIHVDDLVKIVDMLIKKWPKTKREMTLGDPILLSGFARQLNPNIIIK